MFIDCYESDAGIVRPGPPAYWGKARAAADLEADVTESSPSVPTGLGSRVWSDAAPDQLLLYHRETTGQVPLQLRGERCGKPSEDVRFERPAVMPPGPLQVVVRDVGQRKPGTGVGAVGGRRKLKDGHLVWRGGSELGRAGVLDR